MGLDLRPMGKPKPGFEARFLELYQILDGQKEQTLSEEEINQGKKLLSYDELREEWFSIQISTYETIKAPMVGRDQEALEWIRQQYILQNITMSDEEIIKENFGYYVIDLARETDGVPLYRAFGEDENVFRGEFLTDCLDIVDEDLMNEAWGSKLADETLDYGNRLMKIAEKLAREKKLQYLKDQRELPNAEINSIESKLHILFSLSRWLIFYGKNGHGYRASY